MFKAKGKEKRKGLPPSRYAIIVTVFVVVAFLVLVFLLRGPFIERLTVTPTIVSRLVSPGPAITTTLQPFQPPTIRFTATPLPIVAEATGTPTPFGIPITLTASTDLRIGPGETTEVVERVNAGDTLLLIGANYTYMWFLVGYRSRQSWVNAEALGVAIDSLRQLPVIIQEDIGMAGPTVMPLPTLVSPLTQTVVVTLTTEPVVAVANMDIPAYSGTGYEFQVIATLAKETSYQLVGVAENRAWYLVNYFADQARNTRIQAWIPANLVDYLSGTLDDLSGNRSRLPVINLTQAPLMVTAVTATRTPPPRPVLTSTINDIPFPSGTPSPTPT